MFLLLLAPIFFSPPITAEDVKETKTFLCTDGAKIPLLNVCNGAPNCPDASDEIGKLCRRIICPSNMYRCAYGACIERTKRCDGSRDCNDGSDEFRCDQNPDEICSDREFQCSVSARECIGLSETCNGYQDCSDGSDEDPILCRDFPCPDHSFRCSYGGCVHQEVICDGIKDCIDGTDEGPEACAMFGCPDNNCTNYECQEDQFLCRSGGQCIPKTRVCDGVRHCIDSSDEAGEVCASRECPEGWFRCAYGGCVRPESKCNLLADCYDWSDEEEELCGLPLPEGACRLPAPQPATHYTVAECPRCRPGDIVPELTRLDYSCEDEGSLEGPNDVYCQENRWLPSIPICSAGNESQGITCSPLKESGGAVKRCEARWGVQRGWLSCNEPVPVGTRVFLECPNFYEREMGSSSVVCLHDGTWSQTPLSCVPTCGIRESPAIALIVNGWNVTPEDILPWHATLFSNENGNWTFFCGGTLISERVVLTAAHCVWRTKPETIRIGLGILSNKLGEGNEWAQALDVQEIILTTSYQDYEGNYGSDIAALVTKEAAVVNSYVKPACVDFKSQKTLASALKNGGIGLASGFGVTENETFSSVLRLVSLKVIPDETCRENEKRDFEKKYLTYTSFCAGWTNGTGVCNGDSGGGLVLRRPNSNVWEVHGVVSLSPRRLGTSFCDPQFYTIFTKVSMYGDWIYDIVKRFPVIGPPQAQRHPNRDEMIVF